MTIMEHRRMAHPKELKGFKLAYLGDGNNMAHSLMLAAALLGMELRVASPTGYAPKSSYINRAEILSRRGQGRIFLTKDPLQAVKGANAVYTDVWTSMGQEAEVLKRKLMFGPYQVNRRVMSKAKPGALVMHCLPAHRGEEITEDVLEGKNSVVFDQAENRLHAQKAILLELLKNAK
jgi:ornithine carbamoyltransferase